MFDVFYSGPKPNLFPHERPAMSLEHAQSLSRTRYFWWVSYLSDYSTFDWDFQPAPWQAQYTHVWPSQHHEYSGTYLVPCSGEIQYHFHQDIVPNRHIPSAFETLAPAEFDYTWSPHPLDPPYIYVFGNQWWPAEKMPTVRYTVPGASEVKYMDQPRARLIEQHNNRWHTLVDCNWDYSWVPDPGDPAYIYVFGNQWWPAEKMPTVEYHVPGATERKYMRWPRAELLPCRDRWTVPSNVDADSVDYSWVPDPGDPPYIYQFATQHQKTGGPVYTVPGATEVKYLAELKIQTAGAATAIVEIDHMDGNAGAIPNTTRRVRYFDNYRDTLIRVAKSVVDEQEYIWVCSSICDYEGFDFSWHPEDWQATMLHVFASNDQKFGDTFFMHVPTFAAEAEKKALLEWYDVNFVELSVPRRPLPTVVHQNDTHVDAVIVHVTTTPLTLFVANSVPESMPTVPLWRAETKTVVPLDPAASSVIVPREAQAAVKTQLYDYAFIDKTYRKHNRAELQDIVFISYDEPEAEQNWQKLQQQHPRAIRVHGVKGMELALEAAADAATTPWYYAVFAKTEIVDSFDFSFVPDYMQQPKHYIFNCRNASNGLEYGHMGIVLYNSRGIRDINRAGEFGLDYTLSFPHESVPLLSCVGRFATTPYHAWRTAFRETAKLAFFESQQSTVDGQYRLRTWLGQAQGANADWCLQGARDGQQFFEGTAGDIDKLKQSFRWEWLRDYFVSRYGDLQ
jgi:hypothetical protein